MKLIFCPNCKTRRCSSGYKIQLNIGIICTSCDKVIFPANEANQPVVKKVEKNSTSYQYTNPNNQYSHSMMKPSFGPNGPDPYESD